MDPASDTGISTTDHITKDTTPIFTGNAKAGLTITLFDGSKKVGTALTGTNGAYIVAASTLAAGIHKLAVTATDSAGDVSELSPIDTIVIDTTPPSRPAAPTLARASDTGISATDHITRDTTLAFTGKAEAGSTIRLYDGTKEVGAALTGSNGDYTVTTSKLASGAQKFAITATDVAGNISTMSSAETIVIVTTPPVVAITSAGGNTVASRPTISGTGEAGTKVSIADTYAVGKAKVIGTTTVASNGRWSTSTLLAANGSNNLVATDTDTAGNVGTSKAVVYKLTAASEPASLHNLTQAMAVMSPPGGGSVDDDSSWRDHAGCSTRRSHDGLGREPIKVVSESGFG